MRPSQRFPQLDALRAAAVVAVLLFHANNGLTCAPAPLRALLATGWNGVYLFFALSGFLIGGLTLRELDETGGLAVGRFWLRRVFRTWPLYFVLLALSMARATERDPELFRYFTFTQNFAETRMLPQSWSLAIEEQFYFLFPLVVVTLRRFRKDDWLPALCGLGIAGSFAFRYAHPDFGNHTLGSIDSLLWGLLLAYADRRWPSTLAPIRRWPGTFSFAALAIVYLPFLLPENTVISAVLLRGAFGAGFGLLLAAQTGPDSRLCRVGRLPSVGFVAAVSYGIYMIQDRPLFWTARLTERLHLTGAAHTAFHLGIGAISTVLAAATLNRAIELPALRLRDRLTGSGAPRSIRTASTSAIEAKALSTTLD